MADIFNSQIFNTTISNTSPKQIKTCLTQNLTNAEISELIESDILTTQSLEKILESLSMSPSDSTIGINTLIDDIRDKKRSISELKLFLQRIVSESKVILLKIKEVRIRFDKIWTGEPKLYQTVIMMFLNNKETQARDNCIQSAKLLKLAENGELFY